MLDKIGQYWKAIVAFVAPAAVALTAAVQPDSPGSAAITTAEWVAAICACFITSAAVYVVPNKQPDADPEDPPEDGGIEPDADEAGDNDQEA